MEGQYFHNLQFRLRNGVKPPGNILSSQTILLCIVGELARGGFVAVAVSVSYMRQVIGGMQHMTHYT